MAYYMMICEDDSLYGTKKERLMQRQKLVNDLIFIVDPIYKKTHDMTKAIVLLEYILPVSRKYETEYLVLSDERYNDCFLQYKLPLDTNLSSEAGDIEMQITFAWTTMNEDGGIVQHVRKTSPTTIKILPIASWSNIIPDNALSALDQRIIVMSSQIQAIDEYMNTLNNNQVDNLVYDENRDTLHLSAKGKPIGQGVSIRDMLDEGIPVVDLSSTSGGSSSSGSGDNCGHDDCDCHDNVVEFGYDEGYKPTPENTEDNVVEF